MLPRSETFHRPAHPADIQELEIGPIFDDFDEFWPTPVVHGAATVPEMNTKAAAISEVGGPRTVPSRIVASHKHTQTLLQKRALCTLLFRGLQGQILESTAPGQEQNCDVWPTTVHKRGHP